MAQVSNPIAELALRMGDNALILGQRVSAWCGHAPVLEEDIALTNTALDLIGQATLWLGLAGKLKGDELTADNLAFLRDVRGFRNCLLVEQPNGGYGQTLMRQFLFDAWHHPMLTALGASADERVSELAEKAVKEVTYHLERSTDLVIRLGDGSQESHDRMQQALDALWRFTGELTTPDSIDADLAASGAAPDLADIAKSYDAYVRRTFREATLAIPDNVSMRHGGKEGIHTEELGYILAEMQWMQRAYPGLQW